MAVCWLFLLPHFFEEVAKSNVELVRAALCLWLLAELYAAVARVPRYMSQQAFLAKKYTEAIFRSVGLAIDSVLVSPVPLWRRSTCVG